MSSPYYFSPFDYLGEETGEDKGVDDGPDMNPSPAAAFITDRFPRLVCQVVAAAIAIVINVVIVVDFVIFRSILVTLPPREYSPDVLAATKATVPIVLVLASKTSS